MGDTLSLVSLFELHPPLYVYKLREGRKVFLSSYNMNWGQAPPINDQLQPSIQGQVKRYLESITIMEQYRKEHPGRVYFFQLDRFPRLKPGYLLLQLQLELTKREHIANSR